MRKLICLLSATVLLTACGKKGPLIYPDMLVPAAPAEVAAQQRGTSVKLSLVIPSKDRSGRNLAGLTGVKILKRDEPAEQSPGCSACATDFATFRNLSLEPLPSDVQRYGGLLLLLDSDVQAGRRYTYRFQAFTKDNQEGAVSTADATVVATPPAPPVLKVISQPTEILLDLSGIELREGTLVGYNLYRAVKGDSFSLLPLNREPFSGSRYVDQGLERGVIYTYVARSMVRQSSGSMVESAASNQVEARLADDE
jgi:predicted small lipoprotein YifL